MEKQLSVLASLLKNSRRVIRADWFDRWIQGDFPLGGLSIALKRCVSASADEEPLLSE